MSGMESDWRSQVSLSLLFSVGGIGVLGYWGRRGVRSEMAIGVTEMFSLGLFWV